VLIETKEHRRCSTLFHLLVPEGTTAGVDHEIVPIASRVDWSSNLEDSSSHEAAEVLVDTLRYVVVKPKHSRA
jgi:hypothetical protein